MTEYNVWGQPIGGKKNRKGNNIFGGFGLSSSEKYSEEIKRTNFKADFNHLMEIQKGKCAYSKCNKINGKRQVVHSIRDLDHKIPIKLWELMKKKGNVNMRSNLQLLCPGCHRHKNAEDRKKIAIKKRHGKDNDKAGLLGGDSLFRYNPPKRSKNNLFGL